MLNTQLEEPAGLSYIDPDEIDKNPENPRLIFRQSSMDELKRSIYETGILVPLIVYRSPETGRYVLLDGERRWRCARELNMPRVPANIISAPTREQNIIRMFNIHNLREDWEPMPTALKLQHLMELTGEVSDSALARMTRIEPAQVKRLRVLLQFPTKHQDMVMAHEVKHDFLIELFPAWRALRNNDPVFADHYGLEGFTDALIEKEKAGGIQSVTEFRQLAKLAGASSKGAPVEAVREAFRDLLETPSMRSCEGLIQVRALYDVESLARRCVQLANDLTDMDPAGLKGEQTDLRAALVQLGQAIEKALPGIST